MSITKVTKDLIVSIDPSQINQSGAILRDVLAWDGTKWNPVSITDNNNDKFIPNPTSKSEGQYLIYHNNQWIAVDIPSYIPNPTATKNSNDVLCWNGTLWEPKKLSDLISGGNGGGGFKIFDTPGTFSWTAPTGCTRITVELYGGGGGFGTGYVAGVNGGNTTCSIGGITVTAEGGRGGEFALSPGRGGSVAAVAADPSKGFSGVGQGNGGVPTGMGEYKGNPANGTGSNGGYGGGSGGGAYSNGRPSAGGGCGTGKGDVRVYHNPPAAGILIYGGNGGGGVGGGDGSLAGCDYGGGSSGGLNCSAGGGAGHAVYCINVTSETTYTNSIIVGAGAIGAGRGAVIIRY